MNRTVTITLPGGIWVDGVRHQHAALQALRGQDEVFVLEAGDSCSVAEKTTALLSRCVVSLGPFEPVTRETVRSLTVGDREAMLLHVRRLTLGERVQSVLRCPNSQCAEQMDLDLTVTDLLVPHYSHESPVHEATLSEGHTSYRTRFRLPTGADQEAAAPIAKNDAHRAEELLLRRCVESVAVKNESVEVWPAVVGRELPALMEKLDPQAEIQLALNCPSCGRSFSALFDAGAYLFQELAARARDLYREVHTLARHYHWSEKDLLEMSGKRRRLYLDFLAEESGKTA